MCLVAIAWQAHPRYPLVLLGNRDEFHQRPTVAAGWWPEADRRVRRAGSAGRRQLARHHPARPRGRGHQQSTPATGGQPHPEPGRAGARLADGDEDAGSFLDAVEKDVGHYAGFSLLVGTLDAGLDGFITPAGSLAARWRVPAGITVLSNSPREAPWPKVGWLEQVLENYLGRPLPATGPDSEELLALVARRMPVAEPDADTPVGAGPGDALRHGRRLRHPGRNPDPGGRVRRLALHRAALRPWRRAGRRVPGPPLPVGAASAATCRWFRSRS